MSSSYEWNSGAYQRISDPQFQWGLKVLSRARFQGGETVLDAGCGTGRLTAELLRRLPTGRVVALDLSCNMLRTATQQLSNEFRGRVTFVASDLGSLPFQSAFDHIFSTATFHWVPDHDRLFRGLFGALKPGGSLISQCGAKGNLQMLLRRVAVLCQAAEFRAYLGSYRDCWVYSDAESAAGRLRAAGFSGVETWIEPAPTPLKTAERYSEFIANVILHRHLERLPSDGLRAEFISELTRQAANDDPAYELDYWRLNMDARRPPA